VWPEGPAAQRNPPGDMKRCVWCGTVSTETSSHEGGGDLQLAPFIGRDCG